MRRWTITTAVIFGLLAAAPTAAHAQQNGGSFGIGVGVSTFSLADFEGLIMPAVYVPIATGGQFMIEPALGLLRVSDGDFSETFLRLGTGILYQMDAIEEGRLYVGPRIGIIRASNDFGSETNLTLAGVVGGEYFLGSHFSLGGEAGFRWIDLSGGNLLSTTGEFRVRWYFP